ncbi:MAG: RING finger protein [Hydrogenoanaerobacterium sp.]
MEKYIGICCPVCNKPFTAEDDIAVCPQCGAPHHRSCFKELGRCAFTEQHAPGNEWKNPNEQALQPLPQKQDELTPQQTDDASETAQEDHSKLFTPANGAMPFLNEKEAQSVKQLGIGLDDELDGVPVKDIAQFVGANSLYYLPRFKLISGKQPFFNINFSAMLTGFFYFFHRKMYKAGTVMLAIFIAALIPQFVLSYFMFPEMFAWLTVENMPQPVIPYPWLSMLSTILHYVYFTVVMLSGVFANKIYYRFTMKKIHKIQDEFRGLSESDYMQALTLRGRTNKIIIAALLVSFAVAWVFYGGFLVVSYPML